MYRTIIITGFFAAESRQIEARIEDISCKWIQKLIIQHNEPFYIQSDITLCAGAQVVRTRAGSKHPTWLTLSFILILWKDNTVQYKLRFYALMDENDISDASQYIYPSPCRLYTTLLHQEMPGKAIIQVWYWWTLEEKLFTLIKGLEVTLYTLSRHFL